MTASTAYMVMVTLQNLLRSIPLGCPESQAIQGLFLESLETFEGKLKEVVTESPIWTLPDTARFRDYLEALLKEDNKIGQTGVPVPKMG